MLGRGDPTERWKGEQRGRGMWEWIEGQMWINSSSKLIQDGKK